jgi:hypothetical protein
VTDLHTKPLAGVEVTTRVPFRVTTAAGRRNDAVKVLTVAVTAVAALVLGAVLGALHPTRD